MFGGWSWTVKKNLFWIKSEQNYFSRFTNKYFYNNYDVRQYT